MARSSSRLRILPAFICLAWVVSTLILIRLPLEGGLATKEPIALLLVLPVILASFHHGRPLGLGMALLSSLAWVMLIVENDLPLHDPAARRLLIDITLVNTLALSVSWLSEHRKKAASNYKRLFHSMPVGIYISTEDGQILEANQALADLLGFDSVEELQRIKSTELYCHPADRIHFLTQVESNTHDVESELPMKRKDGQRIWVRIKSHVIDNPSVPGICYEGIMEDITQSRRFRTQMEEAHRMTTSIIECLPDATFVVDAEQRVIAWNRAIERMTDVPKEEILGQGNRAYSVPFYGTRRPALVDCIWMDVNIMRGKYDFVERDGETYVAETFVPSFKSGDGACLWAAASPLKDGEGKIVGAIETIRDVTRQKRSEQELALLNLELESQVQERTQDLASQARDLTAANERLLELDRLKSSFLNTVSHDIRTPLTSILGYAKLLNRDLRRTVDMAALSPDRTRLLERAFANIQIIVSEGERLTRLINDFLDLSKIESGNMEWHDTECRLDECVEHSVSIIREAVDERSDLEFELDLPPDLPPLYMDPDRLAQLLNNLLSNAVKFTPKGRVCLRVRSNGEDLEIKVSDTGIGIPHEQQGNIFDRFHQVESGDTLRHDRPKGTGLGLSICREIVEYYSGSMAVESQPGSGTCFTVRLPLNTGRN